MRVTKLVALTIYALNSCERTKAHGPLVKPVIVLFRPLIVLFLTFYCTVFLPFIVLFLTLYCTFLTIFLRNSRKKVLFTVCSINFNYHCTF